MQTKISSIYIRVMFIGSIRLKIGDANKESGILRSVIVWYRMRLM